MTELDALRPVSARWVSCSKPPPSGCRSAAGRISARRTSGRRGALRRSVSPASWRSRFTSGLLIGIGETRQERIESLLASARSARRIRSPAGTHHSELPGQARHENGRLRRSPRSRSSSGRSRSRGSCSAPALSIQAPPNLRSGELEPPHPGGHQRLGRRIAGHARPRQPGGALAAARGPGRRDSRGRPAARRAPRDRAQLMPVRQRAGSTLRCDPGPARLIDSRGLARHGCLACGDRDRAAAAASGWRAVAGPSRAPPSTRAIAPLLAAAQAGEEPDGIRDHRAVRGDGPRFRRGPRRGRSAARGGRGRHRHLRRQPQHQLHEHLHLSLRLLRILERSQLTQTCVVPPTISTSKRSLGAPSRPRRRGATEVCLQGGIHPSYTGETYLAHRRGGRRPPCPTCTCTHSRRSRSARRPDARSDARRIT